VQTGGVERLVADFAAFLKRRKYAEDALQLTRLGECVVDARTAVLWTSDCVDAWIAYDEHADESTEAHLHATVDAARNAVERVALAVSERIERGVGARGLLESEPFARRLRDLRMYLRQPAIDATLLRVGRGALPR
jgi:alkylation response protein AidB-like acyl-CoA dehydrogenase